MGAFATGHVGVIGPSLVGQPEIGRLLQCLLSNASIWALIRERAVWGVARCGDS